MGCTKIVHRPQGLLSSFMPNTRAITQPCSQGITRLFPIPLRQTFWIAFERSSGIDAPSGTCLKTSSGVLGNTPLAVTQWDFNGKEITPKTDVQFSQSSSAASAASSRIRGWRSSAGRCPLDDFFLSVTLGNQLLINTRWMLCHNPLWSMKVERLIVPAMPRQGGVWLRLWEGKMALQVKL